MKKIRINELARELEVKAHEILDRLPELGVQEKKTHSSSIDEDVAIKLRRLYGFDVPDLTPEAAAEESDPSEGHQSDHAVAVEELPEPAPARPEAAPAEPVPAARVEPAAEPEKTAEPHPSPAAPVRPPLAGRPIHPPVGPVQARTERPAEPPAPAPPAQIAPPVRAPSPTPPVAMIAPGRPAAQPPRPV